MLIGAHGQQCGATSKLPPEKSSGARVKRLGDGAVLLPAELGTGLPQPITVPAVSP